MKVSWQVLSLWTTSLLLCSTGQGRSISHQAQGAILSRGLESGPDAVAAADGSIRSSPDFVLRGEQGRRPSQVQEAGGFYAHAFESEVRGNPLTGQDVEKSCSLWWHQAPQWSTSQWISTSTDPRIVAQYARSKSAGFIYKIHADPKLVHIEDSQGEFARYTTLSEWAAAQRVPFDQIMGWWDVTGMKEKDMVELIESGSSFTPNEQYNDAMYSGQQASSPQYQLAGFPKNHKATMQEPWSAFADANILDGLNQFVKDTVFKGDEQRYKEFRKAPTTQPAQPTTDPWVSDSFQLYFTHDRDPSSLRESGGLQPTDPMMMGSDESFSIVHHVQEPTSNSVHVSAYNHHLFAINAQPATEGYVYHVQPAPNSIPVEPTLQAHGASIRDPNLPEGFERFVVMGGIAWGQVRGWSKFKIRGSGEQRKLDSMEYHINEDYDRRYDAMSAYVDETYGEPALAGLGDNKAASPGDSLRDWAMSFLEFAAAEQGLMWTGQAPLVPNLGALVPTLKNAQAAFKSLKQLVEFGSGNFESVSEEQEFLDSVTAGLEAVLQGAHPVEHAMAFHRYGEYFLAQQDDIVITPSLDKLTMFARTLHALGWNARQQAEISRLGWEVRDARLAKDAPKAQEAYDGLVRKIDQVKRYIAAGSQANVDIAAALEQGGSMDKIRDLVMNPFFWPDMADRALEHEAQINQMVASTGFTFMEAIDDQHTSAYKDLLKAQGKWKEPEPAAPEPEPEPAGVPWGDVAVGFLTSLLPNPVALWESIEHGVDIGKRILDGEPVELEEILEATVSIVGEVSSFIPAGGAIAAVAKGAKAVGKVSKMISKIKKAANAAKKVVQSSKKAAKKVAVSLKKYKQNFKVARKSKKGTASGSAGEGAASTSKKLTKAEKTVDAPAKGPGVNGAEGVTTNPPKIAGQRTQEDLLKKLCDMKVCDDELPSVRVINNLRSKLRKQKLAVALQS